MILTENPLAYFGSHSAIKYLPNFNIRPCPLTRGISHKTFRLFKGSEDHMTSGSDREGCRWKLHCWWASQGRCRAGNLQHITYRSYSHFLANLEGRFTGGLKFVYNRNVCAVLPDSEGHVRMDKKRTESLWCLNRMAIHRSMVMLGIPKGLPFWSGLSLVSSAY